MSGCLFCNIVAGDIPADVVYRDDEFVAFADINPVAPTHVLVIPVEHHATIAGLAESNPELTGRLFRTATRVAEQEELGRGYRLVVNTGDEGGQTVHHVHVHILGARQMVWPPG
jgi:histidine triad (HIT) family protein